MMLSAVLCAGMLSGTGVSYALTRYWDQLTHKQQNSLLAAQSEALHLVVHLQQYRGLQRLARAGDSKAHQELSEILVILEQDWRKVALAPLYTQWRNVPHHADIDVQFEHHTKTIAKLLHHIRALGEGLPLSTEHLLLLGVTLPEKMECLGQSRGFGAAAIRQRRLDPVTQVRLQFLYARLCRDQTVPDGTVDQVCRSIQMILSGDFARLDAHAFFALASQGLEQLHAMHQAYLSQAQHALQQRKGPIMMSARCL